MTVLKYLRQGIVPKTQAGVSQSSFSSNENTATAIISPEIPWQESHNKIRNTIKNYPSGWWVFPSIALGLYLWVLIINLMLRMIF
jgi:hypothetical protein